MATAYPEDEMRRLTELYAQMPEEQLIEVASQGYQLTQEAINAFLSVTQQKGLKIELQMLDPASMEILQKSIDQRVVIQSFGYLNDALIAKGALDSAGIFCVLADENIVRMDWFISNVIGGIKLCVNQEDVEVALQILNQPIPESFSVEDDVDFSQPRCPKCNSVDISYHDIDKKLSYASLFVVPLPVADDIWTCSSCGHQWPDPETPATGLN